MLTASADEIVAGCMTRTGSRGRPPAAAHRHPVHAGQHGPAEPPLHHIRRIEAEATDRRWSWSTFGAPLPFERAGAYRARRVRDRFTRPLLVGYLAELGIAVDDDSAYGQAALIRRHVPCSTRRETLEQTRKTWKID